MPELEAAFSLLLKRTATDEEIQHLYQVRDALGIRPNDALWQVLIALEWYQQQYQRFPAEISKACELVLGKVKETASNTAKAASEEARRELSGAVARAAATAARGATCKQLAQWCLACVAVVGLLVLAAAWWSFQRGAETADARSAAAAAWVNTADGRLALEVARSGTLRIIARCEGPGWQVHGGRCFPQPLNGQIYGWDLPKEEQGAAP
jgi:hypothetical protein